MGNEILVVGIATKNIKLYVPCAFFRMECLCMHVQVGVLMFISIWLDYLCGLKAREHRFVILRTLV
jgi:hypothetical protein